jgi:plasmid stability protein
MPALQVRDLPPDIHRRLRERARDERMSISDYVLELLERDLALPTRREWAERLAARQAVETDAAAAVREGREERDREIAEARRR